MIVFCVLSLLDENSNSAAAAAAAIYGLTARLGTLREFQMSKGEDDDDAVVVVVVVLQKNNSPYYSRSHVFLSF